MRRCYFTGRNAKVTKEKERDRCTRPTRRSRPSTPWAVRQEIARQLGEAYPAWRVWLTEQSWWATRRTPLPPGALRYRLYATVTADSPQALRAEIEG